MPVGVGQQIWLKYSSFRSTLSRYTSPSSYDPVHSTDEEDEAEDEQDWKKANGNGVFLAMNHHAVTSKPQARRGQPLVFRICSVIAVVMALAIFFFFLYGDIKGRHLPPYRAGVVLASYSKQDIRWLRELPEEYRVYRYVLDDPMAVYRVPRNQGREAMAYLTYIIEHYDDLHDYTIFAHGHDRGWHQLEHTTWKIRALNLTELGRKGYINFRCERLPGCTPDTSINVLHPMAIEDRPQAMILPEFWAEMFPDIPKPQRLEVPCCGQFAVSKATIRRHSLDWWKKFREPLETDVEELWERWNVPEPRKENLDGYRIGVLYEKTWHVVFGQDPVYCPEESYCREVQYSNLLSCDKYIGFYQDSKGWQKIQCHSPWGSDNFTDTG